MIVAKRTSRLRLCMYLALLLIQQYETKTKWMAIDGLLNQENRRSVEYAWRNYLLQKMLQFAKSVSIAIGTKCPLRIWGHVLLLKPIAAIRVWLLLVQGR